MMPLVCDIILDSSRLILFCFIVLCFKYSCLFQSLTTLTQQKLPLDKLKKIITIKETKRNYETLQQYIVLQSCHKSIIKFKSNVKYNLTS